MSGDLRGMCLGSAYFDTKPQDRRLQRGAGTGSRPVSNTGNLSGVEKDIIRQVQNERFKLLSNFGNPVTGMTLATPRAFYQQSLSSSLSRCRPLIRLGKCRIRSN